MNNEKKIIKKFIGILTSGNNSVKQNELEAIKIDVSSKKQTFGNIQLKKDFWGDWKLSILDEQLDYYSNPIVNNTKLIKKLKTLWKNDITTISFKDLAALDIPTEASSLKVENFVLSKGLFLGSNYSISLKNERKNVDGLLKADSLNPKKLLSLLLDFSPDKSEKLTESKLNKQITKYLQGKIQTVVDYPVTKHDNPDIKIGKLSIELILAKDIKTKEKAAELFKALKRKTDTPAKTIIIIASTDSEKSNEGYHTFSQKIKDSWFKRYDIDL
jgi:hypothetical protein